MEMVKETLKFVVFIGTVILAIIGSITVLHFLSGAKGAFWEVGDKCMREETKVCAIYSADSYRYFYLYARDDETCDGLMEQYRLSRFVVPTSEDATMFEASDVEGTYVVAGEFGLLIRPENYRDHEEMRIAYEEQATEARTSGDVTQRGDSAGVCFYFVDMEFATVTTHNDVWYTDEEYDQYTERICLASELIDAL